MPDKLAGDDCDYPLLNLNRHCQAVSASEVRNLADAELDELRAVNEKNWVDPNDRNELAAVARRKQRTLEAEPSEWGAIILWGHMRTGPFTIIEGNHRLAAYVWSKRTDLDIPIFVGLSPLGCIWQIFDQCPPLMQSLIEQYRKSSKS